MSCGLLRCFVNLPAFNSLPQDSAGPRGTLYDRLAAVQSAGFEGIQFSEHPVAEELALCRSLRLRTATSGRINLASEAQFFAERAVEDGFECATLHVGWGLEDDSGAFRLIDSIVRASIASKLPLYIETHRATICQDMWRTVQFVRRFPEMRFNGDFSHWYTGQEMVYGGFANKLAFIQPVLERVRFLHGRIASPGCIQIAIADNREDQATSVEHFRQLWTACFRHFLARSGPAEAICFAPELLSPEFYYARTFHGQEESDRWQQSLLLKQIAEECFSCAQFS